MTYSPGLGEVKELPDLAKRIGVELEVVLSHQHTVYIMLRDGDGHTWREAPIPSAVKAVQTMCWSIPDEVSIQVLKAYSHQYKSRDIIAGKKDLHRGKRASEHPIHQQRHCHQRRG
jgi:hypothetical protein